MSHLHTLLKKRHLTVTTAESCTGGLIAKMLTDPAGASAVFRGAFVTYCDDTKRQLLGVREETLAQYHAVSVEVAREMALGALERLQADLALSATGIAGPGTDDSGKPVGTVCLGVALRTETGARLFAREYCFAGTRAMIRISAARGALELARRALEEPETLFRQPNASS